MHAKRIIISVIKAANWFTIAFSFRPPLIYQPTFNTNSTFLIIINISFCLQQKSQDERSNRISRERENYSLANSLYKAALS